MGKLGSKLRLRTAALAVALVAVSGLAATGCGAVSNDTASGSGTSTTKVDPNKEVKMAVFLSSADNVYLKLAMIGINQAAKTAGNTTVKSFDGAFDPAKQAAQIQDANASGKYNAYVIYPNDGASVVPPVKQAVAKGIKVVAAYSPIGPDLYQGTPQVPGVVGTVWHNEPYDGRDLGVAVNQACKAKHPTADPCKVAYLTGVNAIPFEQAKLKQFKKAIAANTDQKVELVGTQEGNFTESDARKAAQNILQANSEIDVFATSADQMTLGVEDAVKSAGRTSKITLIGDGASPDGVNAVKAGRWFGTTVYLPITEGRLAAEMAINAVRGKNPAKTDVNVRLLSTAGNTFTEQTTAPFKPEWTN